MVARSNNAQRRVNASAYPSSTKPARNIGKAFVRPGALARYVDAQKISNLSVLKACKLSTRRRTSDEQILKTDRTKRRAYAPDVDITLKSKNGKRVRTNYLSDKHLKFQYATVPTPRGVGQSASQSKQKAQRGKATRIETRTQRTPMSPKLVSLPSDILTRVLCCMKHQDIPPLMKVCRGLADAAKTAITTHFNFLTPDPKQVIPRKRSKQTASGAANGKQDSAQAVFGSAEQDTPRAPRLRRRHRRYKRRSNWVKKRSLVFEDTNTATTTTSGSSGSG